MSSKVFLETTIQIDRNFSNLPRRNKINNNLKEMQLLSSSYVLGEMKFNLLRNAITFYNLLQQSETTNEALDRLCSVVYSTGQYSRVLKIFSFLTEDGNMDKVNVERRLNMLIEDLFESRFYRNITTPLLNETECLRAKAEPEYEDGFWKIKFNCNVRMKEQCKICDFIKKNLKNFQLIESLIIDEDIDKSNVCDIIKTLKEIRQDNKKPYGQRCWKIGDAIISNEVPEDTLLYTTNEKDYKLICEKLNKRILIDD
ncbi:MAG: hypothetical protein HPY74_11845 [Firmicutes bacterium]|nr:hypothetical protein [Bacillota bacterium]